MAQRALIDTTVLYAAGNRSERERHEQGLSILKAADRGELPVLIVPDAVFIETMNGLHRDVGQEKALDMGTRLESGRNFRIVREPNAVRVRGRELLRQHARLSLGDALQLASARHREIEYIYSFDAGFDGFGDLTRLSSVVDPFAP